MYPFLIVAIVAAMALALLVGVVMALRMPAQTAKPPEKIERG